MIFRERKFRDYDWDNKVLRYFTIDEYDRNEHDAWGNIMDFIGLKDSTNKDVYEGDIIFYKGVNGKVIYNENSAMYAVEFPYTRSIYNFDSIDEEFKVVGNIHENPELLN